MFLISISLVAVTFVAYEPVRHNGFVSYDDDTYITKNPNVKDGITRDSVLWAFTKPRVAFWHPLTMLSHMLDCEVYGLNPLGHHITNVLIHIANSVLLFLVLRKMTEAMWASAFAAAVFALHPVHVESVAWAAERKDVLSGLFWMLTMLAYIRYAERPNVKRYVLVLLAFVMGLMAKPMLVTLPFVLFLLDYWPLERLRNKRDVKSLALEKLPFLVLSAVFSVIAFFAQRGEGALALKLSLPVRIANAAISYLAYIEKMVWPAHLAVFYPHQRYGVPVSDAVFAGIVLVGVSIWIICLARNRKYLFVGWFWYLGTLVPVIGLIQVGSFSMADRYMYIPMVGLLIIVAWAVKDFIANRPRRRIVAAVLAAVILLSVVLLTRIQVRYWQNSLTLFEHALKVTKNDAIAEKQYGRALLEAGRLDEARLHFNNALRINPGYSDARNNLGQVFLKEGKLNEAIECFNKALQSGAAREDAYINLGAAYNQLGKYDLAIQNWSKAAELKPDNADVLNNLAWLLAAASDTSAKNADKAVKFAERACKLTWYKNPELLDTLAMAYAAAGRFDGAVTMAQRAIKAAKAQGQYELAGEIQKRMELYRAGQRYQQK